MEYNVTRRNSMKNLNFTNISLEEDTRVLATSYMLYKIGKRCLGCAPWILAIWCQLFEKSNQGVQELAYNSAKRAYPWSFSIYNL